MFGRNIQIVTVMGRKMKNGEQEGRGHQKYMSIVCAISCSGCDISYYGESSRELATRLKEHKVDLRHQREKSALVNHVEEKDHLLK